MQERYPSPSAAIIDSQSVKTAAMVHKAVGYDAGKKIKGRKRFMTVDTLGLVLRVLVTAASVGEREGGKKVLKRVKQSSNQVSRLTTIWVDGGFNGDPFMQWVMDFCRWIVQVVLRPEQTKGFVLLKKRWVVERTFGWLMGCRRLVRDFQEINYSIKIKSPHLNNNDNHFKGVRGGCRRQPPLTPLNIHEKLCTL